MIIQSSDKVTIRNNKVIVNGKELPQVPSLSNNRNITIINDKVFINGYEWKDEKWKRTVRALFHLVF